MNKFENIFKKYNITYNVPSKQKRSRNSKPWYAFPGNKSTANFPEIGSNTNSSYYYNTSTIGKYNFATRCKRLELVRRESEVTLSSDLTNKSIGQCWSKENATESGIQSSEIISNKDLDGNKVCDHTAAIDLSSALKSLQNKRNYLSSSFNIGRRKPSHRNRPQTQSLRCRPLNLTPIDKTKRNNSALNNTGTLSETTNQLLSDSFKPLSSSPESTQIIETPTTTQEALDNGNSELNLLIDLIQREDRYNENKESHKLKTKEDLCWPHTKTCRKGGYQELFERSLKNETIKGNFLKHDRKYGLRTGKLLTVVAIETSYDLTIAVVKSDDMPKNVGVAMAPETLAKLKLGVKIETYFDDKILPYKLPYKGDYLDIYLEPYKVLIV